MTTLATEEARRQPAHGQESGREDHPQEVARRVRAPASTLVAGRESDPPAGMPISLCIPRS